MYRAVTRNIEVLVRPFYLEDRSDPSENRYVWGYQVTIDNRSDDFVQLLSRYWHITDGQGRVEEVRGAGVVGGAIAGGFILGMMESVGLTVLREYGDVTYLVIFAALMVFLSVRPNGLMGKPWG
ncbi:MAG: ApaG domain [Mesorhizobium sp.]|nr:MAG: ApaG domain [Mesorhizobium sp.]